MSHECQYCKKKLSTKSSLNLHQKNTTSCLDIQKSLNLSVVSLKVACEYCNDTYAKHNLSKHLLICKVKPSRELSILKEKLSVKDTELSILKEKLSDKDTELSILKEKLSDKDNKLVIKDKELSIYKELAERNQVTIEKISERNQATIEEIAKQPKTQHIKNTINKVSIKNDYIQNMPPLCLDEDTISRRINQGFTIADFNNGVKGVARVICEEVAIGEDKDGMIRSAIGCTDSSRKIFSYTTENGASINDPKAFNIMSKTQPFIDIKAAKFASDQIQEYPDNVEDISTKYLDIQGIPENETVFLDALSQLSINNMNNYMETQKRKLKSKKIRKD